MMLPPTLVLWGQLKKQFPMQLLFSSVTQLNVLKILIVQIKLDVACKLEEIKFLTGRKLILMDGEFLTLKENSAQLDSG